MARFVIGTLIFVFLVLALAAADGLASALSGYPTLLP